MYLLGLYFDSAVRNHCGRFLFPAHQGRIEKWTILSPGPAGLELLRLMALSCAGASFIKRIPFDFSKLSAASDRPLNLQFILAPHLGRESRKPLPGKIGSGLEIDAQQNCIRRLKKRECNLLPAGLPIRKPALGTGNTPYFLLGYGSRIVCHDQTDDFEFR